jgi:hypothetical protein
MQVKGTAVVPMPAFVKKNFQEDGYQKWLNALPPDVREAFERTIMPSSWYDFQKFAVLPTMAICDLFYGGGLQGAYELGKYSAEYALVGIYKVFVQLGSPDFIIKKSASILPKYYDPSTITVPVLEKGRAIIRITSFPEWHAAVEQRIAGWISRALEISGGRNVKVVVTSSFLKKQACTEYLLNWN